jgi:hypothetical protein
MTPAQAESLARGLLATALPRRWTHVRAVTAAASELAGLLPSGDADLLITAAWLHDVGYAPGVAVTGLHSLDGARWLVRHGAEPELAGLVAYHSCAVFEARARALSLDEFADQPSLIADLLWYADMTTSPDGQTLTIDERLAEIRVRYGPSHLVTRFWADAEPTLREAAARVLSRVALRTHT